MIHHPSAPYLAAAVTAWSLAVWRQWPALAATPAGRWVARVLALPAPDATTKEH